MDFVTGSGLEVPGLEAVVEYNGLKAGDRSALEQLRLIGLGGLQDDPDVRDSRDTNPDRHGERAGVQLYGGRTVTLEGLAKAGSIPAMRDVWRKARSAFDGSEHDMLVHVPGEVPPVVNLVKNPRIQIDTSGYVSTFSTGLTSTSMARAAMPDNAAEFGMRVQATQPADTTLRAAGVSLDTPGATQYIPVVGGRQYTLYVEVYIANESPDVNGVRLDALWYRGDGATSASIVSTSGTMTPDVLNNRIALRQTFIAPRDALFMRIQARQNVATSGDAIDAYWTRFMAVEGAYAGPYVDGDQIGCWWTGTPHKSTSVGEVFDVNLVRTPVFDSFAEGVALNTNTAWISLSASDSGETSQQMVSSGWSKSGGGKSGYMRFRNDAGTTVIIRHGNATSGAIRVVPGETIYGLASLNVIAQVVGEVSRLAFYWYKFDGTSSSTGSTSIAQSAVNQTGAFDLAGSAVVPADAVFCAPAIQNFMGAGAANNIWEFYFDEIYVGRSNASFFSGDDKHASYVGTRGFSESIRRRPRPFLLRRVRKSDRLTSPEKQSNYRAERDFMIVARAADPRIYVYDEKIRWLQFTGSPQYIDNTPASTPLSGTIPTGFTSIVAGANLAWIDAGVANNSYSTGIGNGVEVVQNAAVSPAQFMRAYRSAEGYTYTNPAVRLTGNRRLFSNVFNAQSDAFSGYETYFEAILKRIDNSNYFGARWYSVYSAPVYGHQLHKLGFFKVVAGVLSTVGAETTLATVDPNAPNSYLLAYMNGNVATAGIYTSYPSPFTALPTAWSSATTTLAGADATQFGTGIAGSVGFGLGLATPSATVRALPWLGRFESADYGSLTSPTTMTIPVLGDFEDTPPRLLLAGDVVSPTITIQLPSGGTRQVSLSGTFTDADAATLDFDSSSFKNADKTDRWSTWQSYSDFAVFEPGINVISALASNWTAGKYHIGFAYRDAYR